MFKLSRCLLAVGALAGMYVAGLMLVLGWPASGWVAGIFLCAHIVRRRNAPSTALGSAQWADESDLHRHGMLNAQSGLILGRLCGSRSRAAGGLRLLFARRMNAKEACLAFWRSRGRRRLIVRMPQAIHATVVAPSGIGKGVSFVVPFLRTCEESCVVVDFKGENALLTATHRRKAFGQQIAVLDPYRVTTQTPDCFNPLDFIDKDSPTALDECNDLAKALVIRTGEEREKHWDDSAEGFIAAMIATVVQYGGTDSRSLQTVREFLCHPQKLEMAIKLMCESTCWNGMLARMGGQLLHFIEKEKSSVLTTVGRHLRFLDSLAVAESTKSSSFDPSLLLAGKMTVYLVLPPEHMRAQSALLRVWIGSFLRCVVKGGLQR